MNRVSAFLIAAVLLFSVSTGQILAAGWSPERAAQYLDGRQKAWFEWKPAQSSDGPCVSCHTGMTYLLARPALRRALGEAQPTVYERGLLDRLRAKAGAKPAGVLRDVEVIFAAFFLGREDAGKAMTADTSRTFEQLWTLQRQEGPGRGGFGWYSANLDPWEHAGSHVFGSSLAMLAIKTAGVPVSASSPSGLPTAFLRGAIQQGTLDAPLHDRLAALWANGPQSFLLTPIARRVLIAEAWKRQSADGGWTNEAIGPWALHPDAPVAEGSNAYATAFTTFALLKGGVGRSEPAMRRALEWLEAHQDPVTGAWPAASMNKRRPPDSMEALFMQDAATAFASLALLEAGQR
jgi:squalene-hopene/tetraprenyl-beta-curcumene cyclase